MSANNRARDHPGNVETVLALSELLVRAADVIKLQSERIAQLGGEDIKTDPGLLEDIQTEVG